METNSEDVAGSLDDVAVAARAGRRAASPWWMTVIEAVVIGVIWSAVYGSDLTWRVLAVVVPAAILLIVGLQWARKKRGARRSGYPVGSWAARIDDWWFIVGLLVVMWGSTPMPKGSVATYAILFVGSFLFHIAGVALAAWFARRAGR